MMLSFKQLNASITARIKQSGMPSLAFGIFGLLNYPLSFFYWNYVNVQSYVSLELRLVAMILCLGLVCKNIWPEKLKPYFPSFWYFTILYSLPFFGTYIALQNSLSEAWVMNMLLGLFLFVLLVDWISFVILLVIGTAFGVLFFLLMGGDLFAISGANWANMGYMYLFVLIIGALFSRKNYLIKKLQEEKIKHETAQKQAIYNKQIAGSIAHDLRTPLATINMRMSSLECIVEESDENGLNPISQPALDSAKVAKNQVTYLNHLIDMFLGNLSQGAFDTKLYEKINLTEIIKETIEIYPYKSKHAELVNLNVADDIEIWGDEAYLKNLLNNLLKNAFYFILVARKGEVFIWTEERPNEYVLHVKDTAKGAPESICATMFEPYSSATNGGTGLGLAFCKSVMESFGGSIKAESVEGEYMHFIMAFPKMRKNEEISQVSEEG